MKNAIHGRIVGVLVAALVSCAAVAAEQYNYLDDAAVAQAQKWQKSGKAKPILSSDGKIIFPYGQSMPRLTCSPRRVCDIEMEPGEKIREVILSDKVNWAWAAAGSIEKGQMIQHVVLQPHDVDLESNAIITTDRRTYHIELFAPHKEGAYLNRVGFYYPADMVTEWKNKEAVETDEKAKTKRTNILVGAVSPEKLDFGYRMEGKADFAPIRVFNDSERTYLEMPDSLNNGENPVLFLYDEKNNVMLVNYRREEDPDTRKIHYVVDKLFVHAELRAGSESVHIYWKKREKSFLQRWGLGRGN